MPSEPAFQIEGYEIIEKVAEAGQGQVWRSLQLSTGREVAIKVPRVGSVMSERARLRFEREIELAARLQHPNIARIYDSGMDRGQYYYVMDFIDGLNLDEHVRQKKLTHREILELMRTICQGVQHAHQNGVIHRDLKPSNIIVTDDGRPYVVDFGLAKGFFEEEQGPSISMDGETAGTPAYMSPEQAAGNTGRVDTRTDIYSLGVILFNLLTGQPPYDLSGSRQEVLRRIAEGQVKRPREVCSRIDKDLEWLLFKALDPDPDRRYASVAGLADDIHNYLNGAPLIAGPPSRLYKLRKFVKRRQPLVSAVLVVGLTIGIGSILSVTMYIRAKVQAERSQAVSSFLNDSVLSALDPTRPQGGKITALSVLNAVSESLESRFRDAPLIEASVRHRLGITYRNHDEYGRAAQQLQQAWDIRRCRLGENAPLTRASMFQLGVVHYYDGRHDKAEPLLLEALAYQTRQRGEEDSQTLDAKRMLALTYSGLGDHDKEMKFYQEILSTARRMGGDQQIMAIWATYSIGATHAHLGNCDEAEKWLRRAVQLYGDARGQDAALLVDFMGWLGLVYVVQGHYPLAESTLMESLARGSRIYGRSQWGSLEPIQHLVRLYVAWNKPQEAAKWRAQLEASLPSHPDSQPGSIRYDETTGTYTMSGSRSSGIFFNHVLDEFHCAPKTLHGDGTITARIDSIDDADPWSYAGIMIRNTREPTSAHTTILVRSCGTVEFWHRAATRGVARHIAVRSSGLPRWVRLARRANTFTAQHSGDGITWEEVRSSDPNQPGSVEVVMNEMVYVGPVVASSYNPGSTPRAQISNLAVTGSVSPMGPFTTSEDIGLLPAAPPSGESTQARSVDASDIVTRSLTGDLAPDQIAALSLRHGRSAGSIKYQEATETYTVVGAGKDIWSTSDEFHFAYKRLTGDGSIAARIDTVQLVTPWTKAGVMMRNGLTSASAHASVFITPDKRVCLQFRPAIGQSAVSVHTDPNAVTLPHWIKLVRQGNTFKAQHSDDGRMWIDLQGSDSLTAGAKTWPAVAEIPMNEGIYIGLAVTSHAGPIPAEAKISNVAVTGKVEPPGEFLWSEDIGFTMIMLPKK